MTDLAADLRPDPGQVFESDEHRRVLANLPDNEHHPFGTIEEMAAHSKELGNLPNGVQIPVARKQDELVAWIRKHDPQLAHLTEDGIGEVLLDLQAHGYVTLNNGWWSMTRNGYDALTGPNGEEPPPLEGIRLQAAEQEDQDNRERFLEGLTKRERRAFERNQDNAILKQDPETIPDPAEDGGVQ